MHLGLNTKFQQGVAKLLTIQKISFRILGHSSEQIVPKDEWSKLYRIRARHRMTINV